jgi:hypothetical protein
VIGDSGDVGPETQDRVVATIMLSVDRDEQHSGSEINGRKSVVDFINILRATFTLVGPKSVKRQC